MIIVFISAALVLFMMIWSIAKFSMSKNEPEQPKERPLTNEEKEALRQADEVFDWTTYNEILERKYTGKLPEHIVGSHWTNIYPDIYHTSIAGINYRTGIKPLANTYFDCLLKADPKNEFDPNAIKIIHESGKHIGFIPADETQSVREFLDNHLPYYCKGRIRESSDGTFYIGEINIHKPDKTANK